jgi:predicted DNA-binding WGR domain protein
MKISLQANGVAGPKMWEVEVTPSGVTIRYGSVGKKPRTQSIPLSACENGSATDEALKRAQAKRDEGYWDVEPGQTADSTTQSSQPQPGNRLDSFKSNDWF